MPFDDGEKSCNLMLWYTRSDKYTELVHSLPFKKL